MDTIVTPADMHRWSAARRRDGRTVGLVPTMGALHAGHLALIDAMRERCDEVVVSIFVNPLQFDRDADFDSYPRPIDDDLTACAAAGVSAAYAPTAATMYPNGHQTRVIVGALAEVMEGRMRPGHFDGVTTVVTKLFAAVGPDAAIFGEKDFQQLAIIRRMSADLDLGIDIVAHPIVREADGLALSSRNTRLTGEQRAAAVAVPRALDALIDRAGRPGVTVGEAVEAANDVLDGEPLARAEYVTVFEPSTLQVYGDGDRPDSARAATAVWFGDVRLIDNRAVDFG